MKELNEATYRIKVSNLSLQTPLVITNRLIATIRLYGLSQEDYKSVK
jgi:hypothetical protein